MRLAQTSEQPFRSEVCKAAKGHDPIGFGWREDGDHFVIDWMSGDPAPTAVLQPLHLLVFDRSSYICTSSTCSAKPSHLQLIT